MALKLASERIALQKKIKKLSDFASSKQEKAENIDIFGDDTNAEILLN